MKIKKTLLLLFILLFSISVKAASIKTMELNEKNLWETIGTAFSSLDVVKTMDNDGRIKARMEKIGFSPTYDCSYSQSSSVYVSSCTPSGSEGSSSSYTTCSSTSVNNCEHECESTGDTYNNLDRCQTNCSGSCISIATSCYLKKTYTQHCSASCPSHSSYDGSVCECNNGYYESGNGCEEIIETTCYHYDSSSNSCSSVSRATTSCVALNDYDTMSECESHVVDCNTGYQYRNGSCEFKCTANEYYSTLNNSCHTCPTQLDGKYYKLNGQGCVGHSGTCCVVDDTQDSPTVQCWQATPKACVQRTFQATACESSSGNYRTPEECASHVTCGTNEYFSTNLHKCNSCGDSINVSSQNCIGGPVNCCESSSSTSKVHCNSGYFLPANSSECRICQTGYSCPGGDFEKNLPEDQGITAQGNTGCPAGTYMDSSSKSCKNCGAHTFSTDGVTCNPCESNRYSSPGSTACKILPNNATRFSQSPYWTCQSGYSKVNGECVSFMVHCDEGYYLPANSTSDCRPCKTDKTETGENKYTCPGGDFYKLHPVDQGLNLSSETSTAAKKTCYKKIANPAFTSGTSKSEYICTVDSVKHDKCEPSANLYDSLVDCGKQEITCSSDMYEYAGVCRSCPPTTNDGKETYTLVMENCHGNQSLCCTLRGDRETDCYDVNDKCKKVTVKGNLCNSLIGLYTSDTYCKNALEEKKMENACRITSVTSTSITVSEHTDKDTWYNSYYAVTVNVTGKCKDHDLVFSASNAERYTPPGQSIILQDTYEETRTFYVYPKKNCLPSGACASISGEGGNMMCVDFGRNLSVLSDWSRTEISCGSYPEKDEISNGEKYFSAREADSQSKNVYYSDYTNCKYIKNGVEITDTGYKYRWTRSACGTTPSPTPGVPSTPSKTCYCTPDGSACKMSVGQDGAYTVPKDVDSEGECVGETTIQPDPACYCKKSDATKCEWLAAPTGEYTEKVNKNKTQCYGSTKQPACYCNTAKTDCKWLQDPDSKNGYVVIDTSKDYSNCEEKAACYRFEDKKSNIISYHWDKYKNDNLYTPVTSKTSSNMCAACFCSADNSVCNWQTKNESPYLFERSYTYENCKGSEPSLACYCTVDGKDCKWQAEPDTKYSTHTNRTQNDCSPACFCSENGSICKWTNVKSSDFPLKTTSDYEHCKDSPIFACYCKPDSSDCRWLSSADSVYTKLVSGKTIDTCAKIVVPPTALSRTAILYIASLLLLGIGVSMIYYNHKQKKQNS